MLRSFLRSTMGLSRRHTRFLLIVVLFFSLSYFFGSDLAPTGCSFSKPFDVPYPHVRDTLPPGETALPPLYDAYREYEDQLGAEFTHSSNQNKYLFFANHGYSCGWGNVMQEMVPSVVLASEAGRGYVWDDYTWNRDGSKYSKYNEKLIPSKIPLSAMISGHILGINSPATNHLNITTSISVRNYDKICPVDKRVYVDKTSVEEFLRGDSPIPNKLLDEGTGAQVMKAWVDRLNQPDLKDAQCVEVRFNTNQVFDFWMMGTSRTHALWKSLQNSPVIVDWAWSPLIHRTFEKNKNIIIPGHPIAPASPLKLTSFRFIEWPLSALGWQKTPAIDGLSRLPILALHLRRGDYADHCNHLATYTSSYLGWNSFHHFLDSFAIPHINPDLANNEEALRRVKTFPNGDPEQVPSVGERNEVYLKHCFPEIEMVVKRVREVVTDYEKKVQEDEGGNGGEPVTRTPLARKSLRGVYIMTNGDREWLDNVKRALKEDAERSKVKGNQTHSDWGFEWEWGPISTSRDLTLGWEEKPVGHILDMYVSQRAEVFIGNGFSSLTANTVMLRMRNGLEGVRTRFW